MKKVIQVLSSSFKPGGFKKAILLCVCTCIAMIAVGWLTGNNYLIWLGPMAVTAFALTIFGLLYCLRSRNEK